MLSTSAAIFTRNVIGPIFIELIQRHNHYAFGEGNFGRTARRVTTS